MESIIQFNQFDSKYEHTAGMQYYAKTISIEDQECRLQIWDTGGHANLSSSCEQGYLDILLPYLKQAHGLIVTYDVSDQASFDAVVQYFDLV